MRIRRIETFLLQKELSSTMHISRGGFSVRTHCIVRVTTDEGLCGLGEGVGDARLIKGIIDCSMTQKVQNLNPCNIERIRAALIDDHVYYERKGSSICAASAIEMACWDIKGKALGVPVYELLGGKFHDRIAAYASDIYWEADPIRMARNAERVVSLGFRAIKAHIGCLPPEEETRRVEALRNAIGSDVKLLIDLNAGYSRLDAVRAARLWQPFGLYWMEEPCSPDIHDQTREMRRIVPVACGENEFRLSGFKHLFDAGAVDVAMPDVGRAGGLWETKKICAVAESYGIQVSPHNFSSGILLAATLHVMTSTPNAFFLEMDASNNAVYHELLPEPIKVVDGCVSCPDRPGLGVHLPAEIIENYAVR